MAKRRRNEENDAGERSNVKRVRNDSERNLLEISDEVLLRVLTNLPTNDLIRIESVCHRMRALATDHGIWKEKYLDKFTRPRLRRSPAVTARRDGSIDWKSRYRTKTNWSNGKARLHELEIGWPPAPSVIARVHNGLIFTVNASGLRAWSGSRTLQAQIRLDATSEATCIAAETVNGGTNVLVGFENGSLSSFFLHKEHDRLENRLYHLSADGPLVAVSLAFPYVMTISKSKFLSVYQLTSTDAPSPETASMSVIARFQSDASFSPISGSLRRAPSGIIAAVAYAFNRLHSGWCMGLQEIRLTTAGRLLESRVASTLDTPVDSKGAPRSNALPLHPQMMGPPTTLCYEHPYMIGTLQDNTMMSFLVTSNDNRLEITSGRRLWGHTSAVSGVEVNNRGKAVSISSHGNDVRVWNLEMVMAGMTGTHGRTSTQIEADNALSGVSAALARRGSGLGIALHEVKRELELSRRWVGFDEQQVAVLGETTDRQIMTLFDFT